MITQQDYQLRRQALADYIGDGIAVLPTASVKNRNASVDYLFKADSNFYFLTGFEEADAVAVIYNESGQSRFVLFCRQRDPQQELWNGRIIGLDDAVSEYHADIAYAIEELDEKMPDLLKGRERVFSMIGQDQDFDRCVVDWMTKAKPGPRESGSGAHQIVDLAAFMSEQRLFKSPAEIAAMQRAADLSVAAHQAAMRACSAGVYEYQVQAALECVFRNGGSQRNAYQSIVAGGANACILHYISNRQRLDDGDLLLIDAGAELDGYTADITRTFPVNGKFSAPQKALYSIVLAAQSAALEKCRIGETWNAPHEAAIEVIAQGLLDEGLLQGTLAEVIEQKSYTRFYMHSTGHWLGLDVHDVGSYKDGDEWRKLEAGMVFTVEPGIYVAAADDIDARWHNIGIRIEDNVAVQSDGLQVLTANLVKTVDGIEQLMAGQD